MRASAERKNRLKKLMLDKIVATQYNKFVATKRGERMSAIKKGTKLTDNPKDYMLRVRMDADTLKQLNECCTKYNKTRSEVVRNGIEEQYQKLKK